MNWKELLDRDVKRSMRKHQHGLYDLGYAAGAQIPNERILKLVETLEKVKKSVHAPVRFDDLIFISQIVTDALAELKAELFEESK